MGIRKVRPKPGDVLELKADGYYGYLHYLGRHPEYGDTALVSPRLLEHRAIVTTNLFYEGFVIFYPVAAAHTQGLVEVVGHLPPLTFPKQLRRPGARSGRRIDTWIIENGDKELVKSRLSDEELKFPIAAIWNHELLVQRLREGWEPAKEGTES